MTRKAQRTARLLPGGVPKYVRVYDQPDTADRYTVVYTKRSDRISPDGYDRTFDYRGMSADPFSPLGVCMWGQTRTAPVDTMNTSWPPAIGRKNHLGTRIRFTDLPEPCQRVVMSDYVGMWNLNND